MYPERMGRVVIAAPAKHLEKTINLLHAYKILHIIEHVKEKIDIGSPLPQSERLAGLLVKTRSIIHSFGITGEPTNHEISEIENLHSQAMELLDEQRLLEEQHKMLVTEQNAYAELSWLHVNPVKLRDSKHLTYFFGSLKDSKNLSHAITNITKKHYFESQRGGNAVLVLIENDKATQCAQLLSARGFQPADHNKLIKLSKPVDEHLRELSEQIAEIEKNLSQNAKKKQLFVEKHGASLIAIEALLATETHKAQIPLKFGLTKRSFIVNGWVPQQDLIVLQHDLEKALNKEVHFQLIHSQQEAPIKLQNSNVVQPFETLLKLYTLPRYYEIDPSTLLFLSFPIFFGFMLGDIGYGLVLLAIAISMRAVAKSPLVKSVGSILITSAISSTVFGVVFGEIFGLEHIAGFELHPLIHRAEDMHTLLYVAIAVGIIHITIALIIGFLNEKHHHGSWKAFCSKLSWLILLAGAALLGAGYGLHAPTVIIGWLLLGASVVLIYLGEGIRGLVEIPGILSNIMSYSRLMALGVASAALAVVINEMAGNLFAIGSFVSIIGAVFVLILGHAINIMLGIIGPFLHSLRLHYVEFFTKFYIGGGKPYKPFGFDDI